MKKRNFWMMLLLTIITCGIYGIYWWYCFVEDMNALCEGRSNEKPSPNYIIVILLSFVTCGIYSLIWMYKQGNRMADAAETYGIRTNFNGTTLLLWFVVGQLLCGFGPLIGQYMWIDLFNQMADAYGVKY
ncbi:DUF4234 domain-containing protein [Clostridium sp. AM58-1XD]|uniref:DUF4234 domain-containing protein n=1 Tax=Clostridium sp. AM58-1XD TaxID=2292307 RepID=UPI000E537478|nr:DUF4234 domain-containing protein [Clostridium sp. AM58-1XD]RGZ01516.1 DUF4234 domain-containing protein [Clostridium sp. AM58-1XD]